MRVQARFYVNQITKNNTEYVAVQLLPVTRDKSNAGWSKWTPSGKIEMSVHQDTGASQWFEEHMGKDLAITFEERDPNETDDHW